ncbi:MAG: hypothetical protein WBZ29_10435 [Methanocella sp.]
MLSILQLRIIGTGGIVVGLLLLLWGFLTLAKNWLATGFIVMIIAVTLLYYSKRMGETQK